MVVKDEYKNLESIRRSMYSEVEREYKNIRLGIEMTALYICRTHVEPPVKGKVTKPKLRWRGVHSVAFSESGQFLGVVQRGWIVREDGVRTKINRKNN